MSVANALALYPVIWFMALFLVLPLRLTSQGEAGRVMRGTPSSAPTSTGLRRKAAIATVAAAVIWLIIVLVVASGVITVEAVDWFDRLDPPSAAGGTGG